MKKFFIPFVLLLGLLIFTPHAVRGEQPVNVTIEETKQNIKITNADAGGNLTVEDLKRLKKEDEKWYYFKAETALFTFIGLIICVLIISVFDKIFFKRRKK